MKLSTPTLRRPLTQAEMNILKLSLSALCRQLGNEDVLALADELHELIRVRRACHCNPYIGAPTAASGTTSP